MKPFTISRLNCAQGIFKIVGLFEPTKEKNFTVEITSIEMMGTDGWVLLDQKNSPVINLMNDLHSVIIHHLQANALNGL